MRKFIYYVCHIFIKKDKYVCIGVCSICQLDRGNMFELNGNKYVRIVPEGDWMVLSCVVTQTILYVMDSNKVQFNCD